MKFGSIQNGPKNYATSPWFIVHSRSNTAVRRYYLPTISASFASRILAICVTCTVE